MATLKIGDKLQVEKEGKSGLLFWSESTQTSLNSDHLSYFGLKMGLNFPQKSDMKNIFTN